MGISGNCPRRPAASNNLLSLVSRKLPGHTVEVQRDPGGRRVGEDQEENGHPLRCCLRPDSPRSWSSPPHPNPHLHPISLRVLPQRAPSSGTGASQIAVSGSEAPGGTPEYSTPGYPCPLLSSAIRPQHPLPKCLQAKGHRSPRAPRQAHVHTGDACEMRGARQAGLPFQRRDRPAGWAKG